MSASIKKHYAVESVEVRRGQDTFDGYGKDYLVHLKAGWAFKYDEGCGTRSFLTVKEFLEEPIVKYNEKQISP